MLNKRVFIVGFIALNFILSSTIWCAVKGDFHVSPTGNDSDPGTLAKPFKTIERAKQAVRELKKTKTDDILVLIRGGRYELRSPVHFGKEDSGSDSQKIIYKAYPNEVPLIVGGKKLNGWKEYKSGIYVTDIPEGVNPKQLFEGNKRLTLARYPNDHYIKIEKPVENLTRKAFIYRKKDLNLEGWDLSEARVYIWPGHDWFSQDKPIESVDIAKHQITMTDERGYDMIPGNRFYLRNALPALDIPGECYINLKDRKIYVMPYKDINEVVVPVTQYVISVTGNGDNPVNNIHFEGLDLSVCDDDVVDFRNTKNCSIRFCKIMNGGDTGITIGHHGQNTIVYGNEICDHGGNAIAIWGNGYGQPDVNNHNIIENNHIHHCGHLVGHSMGVSIGQSSHNKVIHNHIHHMPRYGVAVNGLRYQVLREQIKGVTWENHYDFLHSRDNLVAYNRIHDVNEDSQDTGAIESWGPGRDNVYDHNLIFNTGNDRFNLQSGIYIDDAGDYFTITNNIIYGVVGTSGNQGIFCKGIGNVIDNNVMIGNAKCQTGIRSLFMADERCDHHTYTHNIIYFPPNSSVPEGDFNQGLGAVHDPGTTATYQLNVKQGGTYSVWCRYAVHNTPYGLESMDKRITLTIDEGEPVWLENIPDTGSWDKQAWKQCATVKLSKGNHSILWKNEKGGGINLNAFVFCNDDTWQPGDLHETNIPAPTDAEVLIMQAESYQFLRGKSRSIYIYDFNNWSDDRVTKADNNCFWATDSIISLKGGPADGDYEKWKTLQDNKFDQHSIIADPLFVDPENHDYRLRPESPALKIGIKSIDTSTIGLKDDFPGRLTRE